jgi:hypothetical protein
MSLRDDLLQKALSGRLSTSSDSSFQDESLKNSIRPDRSVDQNLDFGVIRRDVVEGSELPREAVRYRPSAVRDYSLYANDTLNPVSRNPRHVQKISHWGVDLLGEGFQTGSFSSVNEFITSGFDVNNVINGSPFGTTASDLRLVVHGVDNASSQSKLGVYDVDSITGDTLTLVQSISSTSGHSYSWSLIAPAPPKMLKWRENGSTTTYLTVLPERWPAIDHEHSEDTQAHLVFDEAVGTLRSTSDFSVDQLERVEVVLDSTHAFSYGDFLAGPDDNTVFVVQAVNSLSASEQELTLFPLPGHRARNILPLRNNTSDDWHVLYTVGDFLNDPSSSPGDDAQGNEIPSLYNNEKVLDNIRIKNLVSPKITDVNSPVADVFKSNTTQIGHGLTLVPEDGSGDPDFSADITDFSNVTIDETVDQSNQALAVSYEEGVISLSHEITTTGGSDLNPAGSPSFDLYAMFASYTDKRYDQEARSLNDPLSDKQREVYGFDSDMYDAEDAIEENMTGWIARLGDADDARRAYPENLTTLGLYGYSPKSAAIGMDSREIAPRSASLRFQHSSEGEEYSTRAMSIQYEGENENQLRVRLHPDVGPNSSSPWYDPLDTFPDFYLRSRPTFISDSHPSGSLSVGSSEDAFEAVINGELVSITLINDTEDGNNNGSYIETDDGSRHIENELVPELRNEIESAVPSFTAGNEFDVYAVKYNQFFSLAAKDQFVIEAEESINILQAPASFNLKPDATGMSLGFNQNNTDQEAVTWNPPARTFNAEADDFMIDDTVSAGAAGVIQNQYDALYVDGFDITTSTNGSDLDVDISSGHVFVGPYGESGKTLVSVDSSSETLSDGQTHIIYVEESSIKTNTGGSSFIPPSANPSAPLFEVEVDSSESNNVNRIDDFRNSRTKNAEPVLCGLRNDQNETTFNGAVRISRFKKPSISTQEPVKIEFHGNSSFTFDGNIPSETLPWFTRIEGNGNTLFVESDLDENDSFDGLFNGNTGLQIQNLKIDVSDSASITDLNTGGNGNQYERPGRFPVFNTIGNETRVKNVDLIGDQNQWYFEVQLLDGTSGTGDFDIEITDNSLSTSTTFTASDSTGGTDESESVANDLVSQINAAGSVGNQTFEATNAGNVDITSPSGAGDTQKIVIECTSRGPVSVTASATGGGGDVRMETVHRDLDRNVLDFSSAIANGTDIVLNSCRMTQGRSKMGISNVNYTNPSESDDVVIKNCTFYDADISTEGNLHIENSSFGVFEYPFSGDVTQVTIDDQVSSGEGEIHIDQSDFQCEVSVNGNDRLFIQDSTFEDIDGFGISRSGLQIESISEVEIASSTFNIAATSNDPEFITVEDNMDNGSRVVIKDCTFLNQSNLNADAIHLNSSGNNDAKYFIENNLFERFQDGTTNIPTKCVFVDGGTALIGYVSNNSFEVQSGGSASQSSITNGTFTAVKGNIFLE